MEDSMRNKTTIFSQNPFGEIWLCSECDDIHLRYGNIVANLNMDYAKDLYFQSHDPQTGAVLCHGHQDVAFICGDATLRLSLENYRNLLIAIGHFIRNETEINNLSFAYNRWNH